MDLTSLGWSLVFLGIALTIIGIILMVIPSASNVEWGGGGAVIFIGPIPIVIGGGKYGWLAILIAVIIALMM